MPDGHSPIVEAAPTFPPKLAAALCKISASVKQLGKSERNNFAKYDFVSVDKFYAAIGGLMAENGVHCIPDCTESEVVPGLEKTDKNGSTRKGAPLLKERWAFTLLHESGEVAGPYRRSVTVPAEGAQAHGSSESYAQKQFLRGVFRVPTGDRDDPDWQEAQAHRASCDLEPGTKKKSAAQAKREGDFEKFQEAAAKKGEVEGPDGIRAWVESDAMQSWFDQFSKAFADGMRDEAEAQAKALEAKQNKSGRRRQPTDQPYAEQSDSQNVVSEFEEFCATCAVPSEILTEAAAARASTDVIQEQDAVDNIADQRIEQLEKEMV